MGHTVSGEVPGARKLDTFVTVGCGQLEVATDPVTLRGDVPLPGPGGLCLWHHPEVRLYLCWAQALGGW